MVGTTANSSLRSPINLRSQSLAELIADRAMIAVTGTGHRRGRPSGFTCQYSHKKWNQDVFGFSPGPFGTGAVVQANIADAAVLAARDPTPATFVLGDATST